MCSFHYKKKCSSRVSASLFFLLVIFNEIFWENLLLLLRYGNANKFRRSRWVNFLPLFFWHILNTINDLRSICGMNLCVSLTWFLADSLYQLSSNWRFFRKFLICKNIKSASVPTRYTPLTGVKLILNVHFLVENKTSPISFPLYCFSKNY